MSEVPEILLINKPSGITSFGVVGAVRKKYNAKKVGHAGTLDPLATGLMVLGLGAGTKKLKEYVGLDKEYEAEIRLGERRSTGDLEGTIVEERAVREPVSDKAIKEVLKHMVGVLRLEVSAYSAMKRGGIPMYKRARAAEKGVGSVGALPVRDMEVHTADFINTTQAGDRQVISVRFTVGSGTYVRSLAEELGKRLGYPATLQKLHRTRIGAFDVKDAAEI